MNEKKLIQKLFDTNYFIIKAQVDGLTHEDSLLQLPFRGNCLNWVLGHILQDRNVILELLGAEKFWDEPKLNRYVYDSAPVTSADDPDIVHLDQMMSDLEQSQTAIQDALAAISEEKFIAVIDERGSTVMSRVHFLGWHEGYHAGQTEYLRQLAGKNDQVP